jgi:hypothetical protein
MLTAVLKAVQDAEKKITPTKTKYKDLFPSAAASSSTRGPKRRRRYVNRDREAAHFRLRHDYFDDDYVYPRPTSAGGIVCG